MIGRIIGHYQVNEKIGAGGMGEVYRASDPRLGRDIALKVLPAIFGNDASRMARFQREAQLLAALNHPNVASLYGLEESDGERALVMELVEGPTLADRIKQGPLPLEDVLRIAKQITEALEYAHERGIIHRDLKPGNAKLRPDGTVKLLDFGLAKALVDYPDPQDISHSPTLSGAATQAGILLGTAAYMAPEQAKGKPVDRRADIWAFGVVLFEMLAGQQAFTGETISDTLASVIKDEPDWNLLPASAPPSLQNLLRRCLRKDPRQRLQAIGDARVIIEECLAQPESALSSDLAPLALPQHERWARVLPWALSAFLAVAVLFALWRPWQRPPTPPRALHLSADIGTEGGLFTNFGPAAVLSADGTRLAFVQASASGERRLYARSLDQLDSKPLAGTEGARNPFFSPDGQWVAFFADGKLKKVSFDASGVVTLCEAVEDRGGAWGDDGNIIFSPAIGGGLSRVSSAGGAPEPITQLDTSLGERSHRWPQVLPGSKTVLFVSSNTPGEYVHGWVVAMNLADHSRKTVVQPASYARYLPSGHLVFMREGTLFAAAFDLRRLEMSGAPVPILEHVVGAPSNGGSQFSVSDSGMIAYVEGNFAINQLSLAWLDRQGNFEPFPAGVDAYQTLRFSPDGTRIAMARFQVGGFGVWIYDWKRNTMTRLTFEKGVQGSPVWTPDGSRVGYGAYGSAPDSIISNLYWRRADGSGESEGLLQSRNSKNPRSFHPSGKWLAYEEIDPQTKSDIWILPLEGDEKSGWKPGKPQIFLRTPYAERNPAFSPDGRWIAYDSDESGTFEVYVRPFPGPGGKTQISSGGGIFPVWSQAGGHLYYRNPKRQIMMVPYHAASDAFLAGNPELWSKGQIGLEGQSSFYFSFPPDEKRAVVSTMPIGSQAVGFKRVNFIVNFFEELRRKVSSPRN